VTQLPNKASKMFGVDRRTVHRARVVLDSGSSGNFSEGGGEGVEVLDPALGAGLLYRHPRWQSRAYQAVYPR
jgi:hypothetical protein